MTRLAAGIYHSAAELRGASLPLVERYAVILGKPGLYRFVVDSTKDDDGETAIVPTLGGGAWEREPVDDRGADLIDGAQTITISEGCWRVLPAGTLTTPATITIDPTGAKAGDWILVTREDLSAHAVTIGGRTMPGSTSSWVLFWCDGSAFIHRQSALSL